MLTWNLCSELIKYCPKWPSKGFQSLDEARVWVQKFMHWYNHEHQHSQLRFVTPAQRHRGEDAAILAQRNLVYEQAKQNNPRRWARNTRNWQPVGAVALNPLKPQLIQQWVA